MNKPRVSKLLDDYANEHGLPWVCSYGGLCARGKTQADAFNELRNHFIMMREAQKVTATPVRGFA